MYFYLRIKIYIILALIKRWKIQVDSSAKNNKKEEKKEEKKQEVKHEDTSNFAVQPTHDPIRDNCRKLLRSSLGADKGKYNENQIALVAAQVEGIFLRGNIGI